MLPERMQEELWTEISQHFGSESKQLKEAALHLQDAGFDSATIRLILGKAWAAGWAQGYGEGKYEAE